MVKNLPVMQEIQVQSLGQEDPLEKEMATYSSILAWKISWTEEPGGLQSMGSQRQEGQHLTLHFALQYSIPPAATISTIPHSLFLVDTLFKSQFLCQHS